MINDPSTSQVREPASGSAEEAAALLEQLNDPAVQDVWQDVVWPLLDDDARYNVSSEYWARGTFRYHGVSYGRSYYSNKWTVLPVEDDLEVPARSTFGQQVAAAHSSQSGLGETMSSATTPP